MALAERVSPEMGWTVPAVFSLTVFFLYFIHVLHQASRSELVIHYSTSLESKRTMHL